MPAAPVKLIAIPALAAVSACIGTTRSIRLKRGWEEPPALFLASVAESGELKSPALKEAIRPLWATEERYRLEHKERSDAYDRAMVEYEKALAEYKRTRAAPRH